jgi:hypothetical protein
VNPPPAELLAAALAGVAPHRPLLAPLASAVAGELEAIPPRALLHDVTKLSNLVRELALSLRVDVAVAEFGTLWDAEEAGVELDWSSGLPLARALRAEVSPPVAEAVRSAEPFARGDRVAGARGPIVLEGIRRLVAMLGERALVGASVTGPATLARLLGERSAVDVVAHTLDAVRRLCDAGARVVWVVEQPQPPDEPARLAVAMAPVWGTIRFYRALGLLHLHGPADGWESFVAAGGPYLCCFDPDAALGLANAASGLCAVAAPPGPTGPAARELASSGRCVLLTHDRELAGRVPGRDLAGVAAQLRAVAG